MFKALTEAVDDTDANTSSSTTLQTLSDQFSCCRIIQYFEREDPIHDDQIENFSEQVVKLERCYMNKSKLLKVFGDKEFKEETTAILEFVSKGEKTIIGCFVLGGACEWSPNSDFFFECMNMKDVEYSHISSKVKSQFMRRIGMDFRDCVKALREGQAMRNREEIFKYRFKWLISMTESFMMCWFEKKQSIFFDHTFEYEDIRINVDVRVHKDNIDKVFIMFSHSNMDDAFKSEEFYKMVAFIILASKKWPPSVLLCCRTFVYCFYYNDGSFTIEKFNLNSEHDLFLIFEKVSRVLNCECTRAFQKMKLEMENPPQIKSFSSSGNQIGKLKGIEKSTRQQSNVKKRIPLQSIENLKNTHIK